MLLQAVNLTGYRLIRRTLNDYVLIINIKKYEIAYHNYSEAKCSHQVQK